MPGRTGFFDRAPEAALRRLRLLGGLLALLGLLFALGASLLFTAWGRARLCDYINRRVSSAMAGELRIEELEEIALPRVRARGVRILDPEGRPAIEVDHLDAVLDFEALFAGSFAWHRAEIRGGRVHVTENARGQINMEETFREQRQVQSGVAGPESEPDLLDLRTMVTSDMVLVIGGGSLPSLRLIDLHGIMRVHVLSDGEVELRFDEYRGSIVKGLPTGRLDFREVKGHVQTAGKRLLRFEGTGRSEGAAVDFELDILTEPKNQVTIDARFPELSAESLSTLAISAWTKAASKTLELRVHAGR